jgi:osmotically-inducible protein OsmY
MLETPEIRPMIMLPAQHTRYDGDNWTMFSRSLAAALAGAALLSLAGCFAIQEKTFGESLDEATAGTTIKSKLFGAGASRFGEVDVEVAGRFVLLSGRVPSEADRAEAERIAWTVSSIDEVANELVIDKFDMGRDINDRWITEQVRARIISDSDVKGVNYNIQVYNGVVYLLGIAKSEDELRRAAEHASKVKGVQKVVSYVKMRDRLEPEMQAAAQPQYQDAGAVQVAPPVEAAAPIVPPDRPPTTRAQYGDPYAPGAAPPPGASNNDLGLQSAPLPPAQ